MVATRRSARKAASPSTTATSTANPSPMFSSRTSATETPATSDAEDLQLPVVKGKRKQTRKADNPPSKRRKPNVFVDVPARKHKEEISDEEEDLEYDENQSFAQDSGSSGSEFCGSDSEIENGDDDADYEEENQSQPRTTRRSKPEPTIDEEDDEETEQAMLDVAIQMSLHASSNLGASGSSSRSNSLAERAALLAAAAERRIADQSDPWDMYDSDSEGTDDEPLPPKKGKGKVKATATIKTLSDIRKERALSRRYLRESRRENRQEEAALMMKLGRKLTYVNCLSSFCCSHCSFSRPKSRRLLFTSIIPSSRPSGVMLKPTFPSQLHRKHSSPPTSNSRYCPSNLRVCTG